MNEYGTSPKGVNDPLIVRLIAERDAYYKRGMDLAQLKCESIKIDEISEAFAQAQSEFEPVTKTKQGYGYKYATLEGMLDVIRPILNKYGLSISQYTDEKNVLYTRLRHKSGQWFESRYQLRDVETDAKRSYEQAIGAQLTYMRRYQLFALLGAQPEGMDNDATPYRQG